MVEVCFYPPSEALSFLVRQFITIRIPNGITFNDKFIPRPDASLVFHFKTKPQIASPEALSLPSFFIAPVLSKSLLLKNRKEIDSLVVCCNASVLSRVLELKIPSRPYYDIPLDKDVFHPLWKQMTQTKSDLERIEIFKAWFMTRIKPEDRIPDQIDNIYMNIVNSSVKTPLSAVVAVSQMSASSLQRKFAKRVGVSPKALMRITRLNYLWDRIRLDHAMDYQDLVFEGHYFDQAHFIKDFKSITGETPGHFFARNQNEVAVLSGRQPDIS